MTLTVLLPHISAFPMMPRRHIRPAVEEMEVVKQRITNINSDGGGGADDSVSNERIHKRHLDEMNSQVLEWVNPCNGDWDETLPPQHLPVKKVLSKLLNDTITERRTLRASEAVINVRDISMWSKHKGAYKFLPILKPNSSVTLRRWHRQMQIFIGSFAYLRRTQLQFDYNRTQQESEISKELQKLKESARSILCEIESAINNTSTRDSFSGRGHETGNSAQKRHKKHLNFLTRHAMEKRLNFLTDQKILPPQHHQRHHQLETELCEVKSVDLIFAKYRYLNYLRSMVRVIRTHVRRPGRVTLDSRSASSAQASSSSSAMADSILNSSQASVHSVEMLMPPAHSNKIRQNVSRNGSSGSNGSRRTDGGSGNRRKGSKKRRLNGIMAAKYA